jgi:phospholipase C
MWLLNLLGRLWNRLRSVFGGGKAPRPDAIEHVVVLMLENHSFDQMLGCFKTAGAEGVDPAHPGSNKDSTGREYFQKTSNDPVVTPDPRHELEHILNQLKDGNSGFVSEYEKEYPATASPQRQRIMDYFGMGDLPALHELAKHFTICDRWYSSVPGPTWVNRFFVHSGTSKGLVKMPESILDEAHYLHYDQQTIFDLLTERGVPWRVYFGDVPQSLVLRHQWEDPLNAINYRLIHAFFADAQGPESAFPAYSFIEPYYYLVDQNDDHPPHSTMRAQRLLGQVYNALRANEELWKSTLLVVVYDEHGGFYDHVPPPPAIPPDLHDDEYAFDRHGVRVPAILISPWVERKVLSTEFDHTSLLRYLIDRWGLDELTDRVKQANSIGDAIRPFVQSRSDTPETVPVPEIEVALAAAMLDEPMNENQKALLVFSEHLEQEATVPATFSLAPAEAMHPVVAQADLAKRRVQAFLEHQRAKAAVVGHKP